MTRPSDGDNTGHGLRTPLEGVSAKPITLGQPIAAPLHLISPTVPREWVDYNGHMSESCYLLAFGDQSDAFFRMIGIDEAYRAGGHSLFTVQTMIFNLAEAHLGDRLDLALHLIDADEKRLHIFIRILKGGEPVATLEQMLLHVDMAAGKTCPAPKAILDRLLPIAKAHATLPRPEAAGRFVGQKKG